MHELPSATMMEAERRLREEAIAYKRRAMSGATAPARLPLVLQILTGIPALGPADLAAARTRLLTSINRERRLARRNSPGYDLNRHIALAQALRGVELAIKTEGPAIRLETDPGP